MSTILYSVSGEGLGHATRSEVVIKHLIKQGHKIVISCYGKSYEYFKKNYIRILSFVIIISLINPLQSVVLSRLYGSLFDIMHQNKGFPSFFEFKNIPNPDFFRSINF